MTDALLVLILAAGAILLAGASTALVSLNSLQLQRLDLDRQSDRRIARLLARRRAVEETVLLLRWTLYVAVAASGAALFGWWAPLGMLGLFALDVTARGLGRRFSFRGARAAIVPVSLFTTLLTPLRAIGRLVRPFDEQAQGLDEEDLLDLIEQSQAAGEVDAHEREIIEAVFEFDDLTVGRLMTPRPELFALPLDIEWTELLDKVRARPFSRIPVYRERSDDIVGILLLKDLLKSRDSPPSDLRRLLISPVFVPTSKSADDMLQAFMERKFHMAFVVDEHGTLVGCVTIDDLLDELVGELETGNDVRRATGIVTLNATIEIEEFAEETGIKLPNGEYNTVGGFVFHHLGRLPSPGDVLEWGDYRFAVSGMDGRRISEVTVARLPPGGSS